MENRTGSWGNLRILFKSALIGALILLLLIPTTFIQNLVSERQQRQQEAVTEINSRWAGPQTIDGPIIGIPYMDTTAADNGAKQRIKRWAWFLPEKLDIRSRLIPEKRYRGIYQVVVYTAELEVHARYDAIHLDELNLSPQDMLWNEAAVFFNLSDVQGLNEDPVLHLQITGPAPQSADLHLGLGKVTNPQFNNPLSAPLPGGLSALAANAATAGNGSLEFSSTLRIKGSGNLLFVPGGRETRISASSSWANPSFTGAALPDLRTVKDSGFLASWRLLALNRKFPQQWKGDKDSYDPGASAVGVDLIVPVDIYQQTTRSVKYGILVILLTFTAFLLIEWIYNLLIHALQYALVGFALCIFYTLLLSLSEYLGFTPAYLIAAAATIGLIAWYVGSLLHSLRMSSFISFLLILQYGFVYILIQSQDYALLMGSVGLFVILAVVMYFSRKVKWEQSPPQPPDNPAPAGKSLWD
jgi:inner membrane protein